MDTHSNLGHIELYTKPAARVVTGGYVVEPVHVFSEDERVELEELLTVETNPYVDYGGYLAEIRYVARRAPAFLRAAVEATLAVDLKRRPVLYFKNCPTGHVPELDFDAPLESKYARKTDYVAEAFHSVFAELCGAAQVTYRSVNGGDMFHDVTPMRELAYSITQRTLNTLHFHFDLPNHNVRPDWVYLLSLRNSPRNVVYTPVVRLVDVLGELDAETLRVLRQPLFAQPKPKTDGHVPQYGVKQSGYHPAGPLLVDHHGSPSLLYFEGCHTSEHPEGDQALVELRAALSRWKYDLFLEERDFVAISNHDSMHARHVVAIHDLDAHKRRWILKTWVVDDLVPHWRHFATGRIHTSDE